MRRFLLIFPFSLLLLFTACGSQLDYNGRLEINEGQDFRLFNKEGRDVFLEAGETSFSIKSDGTIVITSDKAVEIQLPKIIMERKGAFDILSFTFKAQDLEQPFNVESFSGEMATNTYDVVQVQTCGPRIPTYGFRHPHLPHRNGRWHDADKNRSQRTRTWTRKYEDSFVPVELQFSVQFMPDVKIGSFFTQHILETKLIEETFSDCK